jgi:CheY-like chemotaxis protein
MMHSGKTTSAGAGVAETPGAGRGEAPKANPVRRVVRVDSRPASARPQILVVEDDAHDREIYGRMLCYNGFDVLFAATAADALQAAAGHRVDLVLLDLGLPDASGLALLQQLRRLPGWRGIPVIAISGFSRNTMASQARRLGCVKYIEKPASPIEVLHTVEARLGRAPLPGVGRSPRVVDVTAGE